MVKIFNKSGYPDELLQPLIVGAARCVRARSDIVVLIGRRRAGYGFYATAHPNWDGYIRPGAYWAGKRNRFRRYRTHRGHIEATLWNPKNSRYRYIRKPVDSHRVAEEIFRLFLHEFHHIKEFQEGTFFKLGCSGHQAKLAGKRRRPKWSARPEEIRAVDAVDDAIKAGALKRYKKKLNALADWIKGVSKNKKL